MRDLDRKNVSLSLNAYYRLASYGRLGESFSMALERIIDYAESRGLTRDVLYDRNIPDPSLKPK